MKRILEIDGDYLTRKISSGSEASRSGAPCSAWPRLATPPHAFLALNVQLAKQPTAWGDFLPLRSGMPFENTDLSSLSLNNMADMPSFI
ncbi:hypothetical protein L3X38_025488 [Prunus dulcis]|uniref:Uncharacterized protein n=1 Tax=Prunus dulcis TaxID=3755 RepID=A0AAD4W1R1_PRUDU|nr:hypothetical protein L3X38_025488 [Prunus dulcis]